MGQLVADAMLAATRAPENGGAQVAFQNIGGVRTGLIHRADDTVTFGDLFAALPFSNALVVVEMTGTRCRRCWKSNGGPAMRRNSCRCRPRKASATAGTSAAPLGSRVVPGSMTLNGRAIAPDQKVRVVINNFLQVGGDSFNTFDRAARADRTDGRGRAGGLLQGPWHPAGEGHGAGSGRCASIRPEPLTGPASIPGPGFAGR